MTRRARPCLCGGRASAFGTSPSSASTSFCSRFPSVPFGSAGSICRHGFGLFLNPGITLRDVFALIEPALHANHAVSGLRLRGTEIDVRAKSLQRQTPLQVPLFASEFRAVQAARHANLDA